jgi:flagellar hook-length control protein FliK
VAPGPVPAGAATASVPEVEEGATTAGEPRAEAGPEPTASAAPAADRAELRGVPAVEAGRSEPAKAVAAAPAPAPAAEELGDRHPVAVAVNRMTLQRAAHAEVELPELGRIAITASLRAREVDVAISAPLHSVDVLRAAGPQLAASLRDASISLGNLSFGADGAGQGSGHAGGERHRAQGGAPGEAPDGDAGEARPGRVRFVL